MNRPSHFHTAVFTAILMASSGLVADPPSASDFPATPPAPGPAPQLSVPTPNAQRLPNGLEVISVRRADLPLVTAQLVLRRGGEMDPLQPAGLADLTANLLIKGAAGSTAPARPGWSRPTPRRRAMTPTTTSAAWPMRCSAGPTRRA